MIHDQALAVNSGRKVAGQEEGRIGLLIGGAGAETVGSGVKVSGHLAGLGEHILRLHFVKARLRLDLLTSRSAHSCGGGLLCGHSAGHCHRCQGKAGAQAVDADLGSHRPHGDILGQANQTGLAGTVGRASDRPQAIDRGHIDDIALAAGQEVVQGLSAEHKRPAQINRHQGVVEIIIGSLDGLAAATHSGGRYFRLQSFGTTQVPLALQTRTGSSRTSAAEALTSGLAVMTLYAVKVIFREVLPTETISPLASM